MPKNEVHNEPYGQTPQTPEVKEGLFAPEGTKADGNGISSTSGEMTPVRGRQLTNDTNNPFTAWWMSPEGTHLPTDITLVEAGRWLAKMRTAKTRFDWKVVDLLLDMEDRWPQTFHQIAEQSGFAIQTLRNYLSVGSATREVRNIDLPFSFHDAVASLPREDQAELLKWAATDNPTREEFRAACKLRKQEMGLLPPPPAEKGPSLELDDQTYQYLRAIQEYYRAETLLEALTRLTEAFVRAKKLAVIVTEEE